MFITVEQSWQSHHITISALLSYKLNLSLCFIFTYNSLNTVFKCEYIWFTKALLTEKIVLACQSELNINKLKFLVVYEWARMLEFAVKNAINAWKESEMYSINSEKILSRGWECKQGIKKKEFYAVMRWLRWVKMWKRMQKKQSLKSEDEPLRLSESLILLWN